MGHSSSCQSDSDSAIISRTCFRVVMMLCSHWRSWVTVVHRTPLGDYNRGRPITTVLNAELVLGESRCWKMKWKTRFTGHLHVCYLCGWSARDPELGQVGKHKAVKRLQRSGRWVCRLQWDVEDFTAESSSVWNLLHSVSVCCSQLEADRWLQNWNPVIVNDQIRTIDHFIKCFNVLDSLPLVCPVICVFDEVFLFTPGLHEE